MSSRKFETLKNDFEDITDRLQNSSISEAALNRLNAILQSLESEAHAAPERYRTGMLEDVEDYKKQLRGFNAEAAGMGIRYALFFTCDTIFLTIFTKTILTRSYLTM